MATVVPIATLNDAMHCIKIHARVVRVWQGRGNNSMVNFVLLDNQVCVFVFSRCFYFFPVLWRFCFLPYSALISLLFWQGGAIQGKVAARDYRKFRVHLAEGKLCELGRFTIGMWPSIFCAVCSHEFSLTLTKVILYCVFPDCTALLLNIFSAHKICSPLLRYSSSLFRYDISSSFS
jgi:hypothetical protein